jgi:hypothetical protein
MSRLTRCLAILALSISIVPNAYCRLLRIIPYDELLSGSDLVAIARPITKSADTNEKTYFSSDDIRMKGEKVPAIGRETTFEVFKVIKGDSRTRTFVLHHYRDATPQSVVVLNGPDTVSFDPNDPTRSGDTLLFLVREKDGRYRPYGGQTDPGANSIFSLACKDRLALDPRARDYVGYRDCNIPQDGTDSTRE